MRRLLKILTTLSLVLLVTACGGNEGSDPSTASDTTSSVRLGKVQDVGPKPVPDLTLKTMDGEKITLTEQKGRALIINFWATWCAPCRKEIPDLKALHSELKSKGLTVIGVALDRQGREVVAPFVKKHSINYPIVIDTEGTVEAAFGPIPGLPTTFIVTPDGQVSKRVIGVFPTDKMKPTLRKMLGASGSSSGTT
ncbi:MAG: TlpA disulfide reductase family protein [Salinibacter sp.]